MVTWMESERSQQPAAEATLMEYQPVVVTSIRTVSAPVFQLKSIWGALCRMAVSGVNAVGVTASRKTCTQALIESGPTTPIPLPRM